MRGVFYFYNMHSFIFEVLKKLISKGYVISQLTFVLPNKRAGLFLKKELAKQATPPIFLPEIISIESFVEEVSQLKQLNNIEAFFEFYALYASTTPRKETEPFDRFSKWATIVLQDFNEIDRHLVDPTKIFKYLSAIQEINHWSLDPNPTDMIKGYLRFWKQVGRHYDNFSEYLLNKDLGYQGLIYKNAVHNLEAYLQNTKRKTHIFLGFNALNAAESSIIQELLQQERAEIFWDADKQFLNSPYHDAGLFMRRYKKEWPYYRSHPFNGVAAHYMTPKAIHITGASKQISQVKYVGELLSELSTQNKLENTALILADENLLLPVLNALPPEVESVNITMGLPLAQAPLASFIDQWFKLQVTETGRYYYKDIIGLLSHPFVALLLQKHQVNNVQNIIHNIKRDNLIALSCEDLLALAPVAEPPLRLLFEPCHASPKAAIQQLLRLFIELKKQHQDKGVNNALSLEYIYRFSTLFQQIENYDAEYNIVDSIKTLQLIFKDVLTKETLNFKGQPLNGLQIMGMLESRVLDFETVIIVSVNEGILPAGKTQNSFIPFDVKTENNLPTYKEKDAVYTYHFYRLLHRANEVHLVYNTEPEALKGGEPSRFIAQLELDGHHQCHHQILTPKVPKIDTSPFVVKKTKGILESLQALAKQGLSPSSLGQYIRNPIDFYNQKILGLKENNALEETVEAITFGSVVHYTLEAFYKPFVGQLLDIEKLLALKPKIEPTVRQFFKELYKKGDTSRGKNLISFEIAKRYILNFLDHEIEFLKKGHKIELKALELPVSTILDGPEFDFPICLKGNIDRIDSCDGVPRILDYKTSKVNQTDLNLVDWPPLVEDYKAHNKSFQLLMYAYMLHKSQALPLPSEAGIFSFKNLNAGVLKFTKKDKPGRGAHKQTQITPEILEAFEAQLKVLLSTIFDIDNDFIEKKV